VIDRQLLLELYHHMASADAAVWKAVLAHRPAHGDRALRSLLHHVHLVQRVFLAVWREEVFDPRQGEELALPELARWAEEGHAGLLAEVANADGARLEGLAKVPWTAEVAGRLGFEPGATTVGETMLQVALHTAHHRGQVCARLRELGGEPPMIDYIAWLWRRRPAADWPR
jgi:uncharacterized damage-inducible protein DinB